MRKIDLPISKVGNIMISCAGNIQNKVLAAKLVAAQPYFSQQEQEYALRATNNNLHTFPMHIEASGITQEEMSWLYSKSFARKGSPSRLVYDALKALAPGEICPLCNQRVVRTLDHHLAKKDYPGFAITPYNLVPSCRDCNSDTLVRSVNTSDEQTFHPYFDNVDDEIWLYGNVEENSPPVIRFEARPPAQWDYGKRVKVTHHFNTFKLASLYSAHAASELQNIYGDIELMAQRATAQAISAELTARAHSRRRLIRNTWQAAMYSALADSAWFCHGGFQKIIA